MSSSPPFDGTKQNKHALARCECIRELCYRHTVEQRNSDSESKLYWIHAIRCTGESFNPRLTRGTTVVVHFILLCVTLYLPDPCSTVYKLRYHESIIQCIYQTPCGACGEGAREPTGQ